MKRAIIALTVGMLTLSACRSRYEFTVVQNDNNPAILARVSKLLESEGFEQTSQLRAEPRTYGCRVVDDVGGFSKRTESRLTNRWFSVTYLVCDGHLKFDVTSTDDDSLLDKYEKKLVTLLRHELKSEIASEQVIVKTKQYVALGP